MKASKCPAVFLRLAQDLSSDRDVEWIMVGAPFPDRKDRLDFDAAAAKVDKLTCTGPLPQERVNELLGSASVFVNTSEQEGFANTFVQAWLHGVPVVSLNANPDRVLDLEGIGFCAEGDYARLRDYVKLLLADNALRAKLGSRAARYAERHYTEKNADRVIAVIESDECR